ncbi:MAG: hypothetical protein JW751_25165, partial [Polyangiaceae bacterium]|nr:hypothetical protein [Polyangiaceae bacterium]
RVLKETLATTTGKTRIAFTDEQRRRLAIRYRPQSGRFDEGPQRGPSVERVKRAEALICAAKGAEAPRA